MALNSNEESSPPVLSDLRIVLLGKTGSGKSATGNSILGHKAFKSDISPKSVTTTCETEKCHTDERTVSVIDTPGVFDTSIEESQLKIEIERCIMLSLPGPHIFLLVIRLDARFTQEEKKAIKWIEDNFGAEASKYTLVVFTRGDELKEKSIETYLEESSELRDLIRDSTAGYVVFDNTDIQNRTQVADLLEKIDEIVQFNGNYYTSSIYEEVQRKMRSDEWWKAFGKRMNKVGFVLAGAAVGPAYTAGCALMEGEAAAAAVEPLLMLAAAGVSQVFTSWMKPKTKDS